MAKKNNNKVLQSQNETDDLNDEGTEEQLDLPTSERKFRVKHTQVGAFSEGQVFTEGQFEEVHGHRKFQRLLDLDAIEEVTGDEDALPSPAAVGPENPAPAPEGGENKE